MAAARELAAECELWPRYKSPPRTRPCSSRPLSPPMSLPIQNRPNPIRYPPLPLRGLITATWPEPPQPAVAPPHASPSNNSPRWLAPAPTMQPSRKTQRGSYQSWITSRTHLSCPPWSLATSLGPDATSAPKPQGCPRSAQATPLHCPEWHIHQPLCMRRPTADDAG